ncbi:GDP-mannose mannosyl hydrolase [Litchfieldella anticariensis]|uniref:GDP-mannose mannosyl hydrolase n=1 Tax=Litchfieldella anticariensis TaxID=258591 RepID=UPI0009DC1493|nr:GDP-mannose mannosyl hydrolase [Halomonas anticariensis]
MWLSDKAFQDVVHCTPLISLDFVVVNPNGEWLLGKRVNRPAQGKWFVPGGRVLKGERLDNAFCRLMQGELGIDTNRENAHFLGVYEHFYEDSVFGEFLSTHYVVLGYMVELSLDLKTLPDTQHASFRWWPLSELLASQDVHANTQAYAQAVQSIYA